MYTVTLNGKQTQFDEKRTILSLVDDPDKRFVAAKVNNRLRELSYELGFDCEVKLLDLKDSDAVKVYETSLRYLIAMAFHNVYPEYKVKICYGISRSLLVAVVSPKVKMDSAMLAAVIAEMRRLVAADLPFTRMTMSKSEAYDMFVANGDLDKAVTLQYRPEKICHFHKCGDYINYMYGYVVPSTGYLKRFRMFTYDGNFICQYPRYEMNGEIPEFKDEPTFSKVLNRAYKWAKICNADLISGINAHVSEDTEIDFINMNETLHNDMLHDLGNQILSDIENIKLICIAGPSSSGKTTFSNRLRIELMARGITPLRISLDMYYKNREDIPYDEHGVQDFEDINALDIDLFNEQIQALLQGDMVELPVYQFGTGGIDYFR